MAQRVTLVLPSGRVALVPIEKASGYLDKGARLETDEEADAREKRATYGTTGQAVVAGLEGAARAVTFGGYDVAAPALGVDPEGIAARREENPLAEGIGQAGGILASMLVPVPGAAAAAATAAKAGRALKAAEQVAAKTAAGAAAEHAVPAVATKARSAADWSARWLARAAGEADTAATTAERAKLARAVTPVQQLARAGKAIDAAVAQRLGGGAAARIAGTGAGAAVEGAAFGAGQVVSAEALGEPGSVAEKVATHVGLSTLLAGGAGAALRGLGIGAGEAGKKLLPVLKRAVPAGGLEEFAGGRLVKQLFGEQRRAYRVMAGKERDQAAEALMVQKILPRVSKVADQEELTRAVHGYREKVGQAIGRFVSSADVIAGKARIDARKVVAILRADAKAMARSPGTRHEAAALLEEAKAIEKLIGKRKLSLAEAVEERRRIAPTADQYKGLALKPDSDQIRILARRDAATAWNKVVDDAVGDILDPAAIKQYQGLRQEFSLASDLAEFGDVRRLANQGLRDLSLSTVIHGTGAAAGALASGMGGVRSLAVGAAASAINKLAIERGNTLLAHAAIKLASLTGVQRGAQATTTALRQSVGGFLAGARSTARPASIGALTAFSFGPAEGSKPASRLVAYEGALDKLARLAANPEAQAELYGKAGADLLRTAPAIAASLASLSQRAAAFLLERAPKDPTPPGLVKSRWRPSGSQLATFERYWVAVLNPKSVFDDFRAGRLSPEGVEAMAAVYPEMLAEFRAAAKEQAAQHKGHLSRAQIGQLSLLFGEPVDGLQDPATLALLQQNVTELGQGIGVPGGAPGRPRSGGGSGKRLKLGERTAPASEGSALRLSGAQ